MNQHLFYDVFIAPYTTYRVGGKCKRLVLAQDLETVIRATQISEKYVVLGKGSKVLFSDYGYNGTVILMKTNDIYRAKVGVYAQSGVSLPYLSRQFAVNSLSGMEFACCIPASVGGAIKMNAGAHGQEISNLISFVDVLQDGIVKRLSVEDCKFGYRNSGFNNDDVILGACFKAIKGESSKIKALRSEFIKLRLDTQPKGFNCGSIFKNPNGFKAGKLIEDCGLKGLSLGDAQISDTHANFIINRGLAYAKDIYTLIRAIKAKVYSNTNVKLIEEVKYIGEFD